MSGQNNDDKHGIKNSNVNRRDMLLASTTFAAASALGSSAAVQTAQAQAQTVPSDKPNIIMIVSDDFGYGDAGAYGGGPGRGMPTPNLDRLADEGMIFFSFYGQPSCTPGRAAMQTGRIPNRSGMTTVAFQGQGGGINGEYVDTPDKGVVGIPFLDAYVEKAATDYLDRAAKAGKPFFMSVNFMKVHQPNLPHPDFVHKSLSKSKFADSIVEADTRIGHLMDKIRSLGLDKNTYVFWTTDNGAWQDVYPDAGYTPFRGTKGTDREGGNRVPAIAWGPKIKAGSRNFDIVGGLDYMATFASLAGINKLPENDRDGQPIIFDSYDLTPVLFGAGTSQRTTWYYFTEDELTPGAIRYNNYKFVFNLRGDDGAQTGGLAVDTNLGWKGAEAYVATVPQIFDLWQDPQERYDIFMTNFTERTWMAVPMESELKKLMETYVKYPPRKMQGFGYHPISLTEYQRFDFIRQELAKEGVHIPLPTGN